MKRGDEGMTITKRSAMVPEDFGRCASFHGHICPGLAIGYRAARAGLEKLSDRRALDEELVAVVENKACGVDAVQVLTGCTFGKGNLVYRDHGKHVFTFFHRDSGKGVRVSLRAGALNWGDEHRLLLRKIRKGEATMEERGRFQTLHLLKGEEILEMPLEDLFELRDVRVSPPPKAEIEASVPCDACGEPTMASRLEERNGKRFCKECAGRVKGP